MLGVTPLPLPGAFGRDAHARNVWQRSGPSIMRFRLLLAPVPRPFADALGLPRFQLPGRAGFILAPCHGSGGEACLALAFALLCLAQFLARLLRHVDRADGGD